MRAGKTPEVMQNFSSFINLSEQLGNTCIEAMNAFHKAAGAVSSIFLRASGWTGDPLSLFLRAAEEAVRYDGDSGKKFFEQVAAVSRGPGLMVRPEKVWLSGGGLNQGVRCDFDQFWTNFLETLAETDENEIRPISPLRKSVWGGRVNEEFDQVSKIFLQKFLNFLRGYCGEIFTGEKDSRAELIQVSLRARVEKHLARDTVAEDRGGPLWEPLWI